MFFSNTGLGTEIYIMCQLFGNVSIYYCYTWPTRVFVIIRQSVDMARDIRSGFVTIRCLDGIFHFYTGSTLAIFFNNATGKYIFSNQNNGKQVIIQYTYTVHV